MSSEDPSVVITNPPSVIPLGEYRSKEKEDEDPEIEDDGGLRSSTPSTIPPLGPQLAQLEQLMTMIDNLRRENTDLRNRLTDQNMIIQHKSKNLEQINDNYRKYDETVKQIHQETAEKFSALKEENKKLKEELKQMSERRDLDETGTAGGRTDSQLGEEESGTWTKVTLTEKQGQQDQSAEELENVKTQLETERHRSKELVKGLQQENEKSQRTEEKLQASFNDLAKLREERKKENQELRANLNAEVIGYKHRIQSLLNELAESKRNLTLHGKKVKELHEANLQFDQVNSAYHNKLAMYEEELKKRDTFIDKLRQENYNCKHELNQSTQRIEQDQHDKQELENELRRMTDALRQTKNEVFEKHQELDSSTARVVSMEESLEARDHKLKDAVESNDLLQVQLRQYQEDFERERMAREHSHQANRQVNIEVTNLKKKNEELQNTVDQYARDSVQSLRTRLVTPPTSPNNYPPTPEPPYVPFRGPRRSEYGWDEAGYHQHQPRPAPEETAEEENQFTCPFCSEIFSESGSLEIHVQRHIVD